MLAASWPYRFVSGAHGLILIAGRMVLASDGCDMSLVIRVDTKLKRRGFKPSQISSLFKCSLASQKCVPSVHLLNHRLEPRCRTWPSAPPNPFVADLCCPTAPGSKHSEPENSHGDHGSSPVCP